MRALRPVLLSGCLLLAGCGSTTEERGLSGAGIGAAGGAVLGAVTGMSIVQGVVIGAAAGGLTGALTDEDTINLGKPAWKKDGQAAQNSGGPSNAQVREIQGKLAALGYDPGPADGMAGPRTAAAIRSYQADHGLPVDGTPTAQLAEHLGRQSQSGAAQTASSGAAAR